MTDFAELDCPIWNALTTVHRPIARINGAAIRYPSDVSPLSGLREYQPHAFADLRQLVEPGEAAALFTLEPITVPADWKLVRISQMEQMICEHGVILAAAGPVRLTDDDMPRMLALTAATEPGPFRPRTNRMGRYFGIKLPNGTLASMAGERLQTEVFTEVSAVCTDPLHRGHGYAVNLVAHVARLIVAGGKLPFLHVLSNNTSAIAVYRKVGFTRRRVIQLTVITPV